MRVITLNVNGVRSAAKKGVFRWLAAQRADVVCLQELKCHEVDLDAKLHGLKAFSSCYAFARKKGYSGVALLSRKAPDEVKQGFASREFDAEGRYVEARYDRPGRKLSIVSCYFPSGSSSEERQQAKFRFLDVFHPHLERLAAEREFILVGDINIAHREIDLRNWKSNQKNSGFLPEERAWMSRTLDGLGLVDVHRSLRPDDTGEAYTWWSNRGQAWAKNVGWRIDYQIATPGLASAARTVAVHKATRFSDHAPLIIDYDFDL